jgi:hypothetical protein
MRLIPTKLETIALTIITNNLMLSPLCLLFLVRLGGYIVYVCDFYFNNIIGTVSHVTGPFPVSPVPDLPGEDRKVAHRYRL